MRHNMKQKMLNRTSAHRKALFANLSSALVKHEQIKTTLPKAKAMRPVFEKMITKSKENTLAIRRQLLSFLRNEAVVEKMLSVLGPRYKERQGGYVRILKAGFRFGDNAPMAIIELVDRDVKAKGADQKQVAQADETAEKAEVKQDEKSEKKTVKAKTEKKVKAQAKEQA